MAEKTKKTTQRQAKTKMTDAQIAQEQGVSRQAILDRRNAGWTEEEIRLGKREGSRKSAYNTNISEALGMSVAEAARLEAVSTAEIYRRFRKSPNSVFKRTAPNAS